MDRSWTVWRHFVAALDERSSITEVRTMFFQDERENKLLTEQASVSEQIGEFLR